MKKSLKKLIAVSIACIILPLTYNFTSNTTNVKVYASTSTSLSSSVYTIELSRWGIKNDKTDPVNTTSGINAALVWASENGYKECVLPKGEYLIDEKCTVKMVSNMVLNLNGSTLKVNPNGLQGYVVVTFNNVTNSKICNGFIKGDRYEHNYDKTVHPTHEFGFGIGFYSGTTYSYAENLEISECTGDSINTGMYGKGNFESKISVSNIELGDIADNGTKLDSTAKVRTKNAIQLASPDFAKLGYFRLTGHAYWGYGSLTYPYYDIFFYDANNNLISFNRKINLHDKVTLPSGAKSVHLAFYQNSIKPFVSDNFIWIKLTLPPDHIYIQNNKLYDSRRCGISLFGTNIKVINNEIYNINGTAPQCAMDMEEGWGENKNLEIATNNIHDVKLGIILISGIDSIVRDNIITKNDIGLAVSSERVIITNNSFTESGVSLKSTKERSLFEKNTVSHSTITLNYEGALINGCSLLDSSIRDVGKLTKPYEIDSCIFESSSSFGNNMIDITATVNLPNTIKNSTFKGLGSQTQRSINNVYGLSSNSKLIIDNCIFDNTAAIYAQNTDITNSKIYGTNLYINNALSTDNLTETNILNNQFKICNNKQSYYTPIVITELLQTPSQTVIIKNNSFEVENNLAKDVIQLKKCKNFIFEDNKVIDPLTNTSKAFIRYINAVFSSALIQNNTFTSASTEPYAYDTSSNKSSFTTFKNNIIVNYKTKTKVDDRIY